MQIWHCGQDVKAEPAWIRFFQISLAKLDLSPLWTRKRWVALSLAGILLVTSAAQAAVVRAAAEAGVFTNRRGDECFRAAHGIKERRTFC